MRIGLIASPYISVPPVRYGGTELFIAHLAEALIQLGADVTVYTNGESGVRSDRRFLYPFSQWPLPSANSGMLKELDHFSWAVQAASSECDVIHLNSTVSVPFSRFTDKPVICTLHHPPEPQLTDIYERYPDVTYVAISADQARSHPTVPSRVIYHGIDLDRYEFSNQKQPYVCFLGRICPIKGTHHAISIAKRAGIQLKICGEIQPMFKSYFESEIRPHIDGKQVQFLGEADMALKNDVLRSASALLFPIEWSEPFGLIMIEAMACGTPVIAYPGGAVDEVVRNGVSGWMCCDEDEAVAAIRNLDFRPELVRRYVKENFSSDVMAKRYLALYSDSIEKLHVNGTELLEV